MQSPANVSETPGQQPLQGQQWQDILDGPTPAGAEYTATANLHHSFLCDVFSANPAMSEDEVQRFVNEQLSVASIGMCGLCVQQPQCI